jgi:ABC-2 type transport system ATP-binding protein
VITLKTAQQAPAIEVLRTRFAQVQPEGQWIRLFVDAVDADNPADAEQRVRTVLAGIPIDTIRVEETQLEDAFTALLRQHQSRSADPEPLVGETQAGRSDPPQCERGVAIGARELSKNFGDFKAVDRVNFEVREGEIFGLLGANGAGKTTVIKMLTGIMRPTSGGGSVAGADLSRLGRAIKQRIGYMSQQFSLYTDLTVVENILLYAGIYGLRPAEARVRCHWICEMAGLSGHIYERTADLPVGRRQRLALGCALVHRPHVLFLDEPTSGIDPIGRQQFWRILFQLSRAEGVTILVTTHYMSEAEHCDHLGLMHAGRLVADASPEALKHEVEAEAGQLLEIEAEDAVSTIDRLVDLGFSNPEIFGHHVHLLSKSAEQDAARIRKELRFDDPSLIRVRELSMDDVFVHRIRALERSAAAPSRV